MSGPRIVTLTVNPAVDVAADAAEVRPVHKIRTFDERYDPGGGGINVARVVHELGGDTVALFAGGGVTGRFVEEMLSQSGVPSNCIPIRGPTRISLTVREQASGAEYRFVPQGPRLDTAECTNILEAAGKIKADWLVASGSLPPGVPPEFYASVAQIAARRGIKFALDTSGPALRASLGHGVDLLKPSLGEFESIVGREYSKPSSRATRAVELVRSGAARMIALTLGGEGAILATAEGALQLPAMAVKERTGVGAGDSFLAGLVLGLARGQPRDEALRLAIAAGAAAVAGIGTARVQRAEVEALYRGFRPEVAEKPVRAPFSGA
ncbi:MAG: 1-phosphofructokinase family hexose kinase [Reyranella sp.]